MITTPRHWHFEYPRFVSTILRYHLSTTTLLNLFRSRLSCGLVVISPGSRSKVKSLSEKGVFWMQRGDRWVRGVVCRENYVVERGRWEDKGRVQPRVDDSSLRRCLEQWKPIFKCEWSKILCVCAFCYKRKGVTKKEKMLVLMIVTNKFRKGYAHRFPLK